MIYFVSQNKHLKIGYSNDPAFRVKCLQTSSPIKLKLIATMPGDSKTESGLHYMFNHLRARGEWFRYTDELKLFVRTVKENPSILNIKSLQVESLQTRLKKKAKRLGKDHKLSKQIKVYCGV